MIPAMPPARKASYLLFIALVAGVCYLRLGPVLLAGLFSYMVLDLTDKKLHSYMGPEVSRYVSLTVFLLTAVGVSWLFANFARLTVKRLPLILGMALPAVDGLAVRYGYDLPFDDLQGVKAVFIQAITANGKSITAASGLLTRGFFQIIVGVFIAVTRFLGRGKSSPLPLASLAGDLSTEMTIRLRLFMTSYEKVLGAQVVISLINTFFTAIFLSVAGIPYVSFLTLSTFILGIVPLAGNILSNTIIVGAALTISPQKAAWALIFLVVIHKAEYFLNSRIIGSSISTPMWLTLTGLLVGEMVMGVPGVILAPALLHYVREELAGLPPLTPAKAAASPN